MYVIDNIFFQTLICMLIAYIEIQLVVAVELGPIFI